VGDTRAADAQSWLDDHLRWGKEILAQYVNHQQWPKADQGLAAGSYTPKRDDFRLALGVGVEL